ncbi:MAG: bifunctional heptose 7-phosphate kinase/heptose 1-phosphate adenyltransferase, partial [Planctomycetota bacterium]
MNAELLRVIEELPVPSVLVAGDLIADRYVRGAVERVSPEAPIQVLLEEAASQSPGGTGAVARNLARLGARVRIVGVVGEDAEGGELKRALKDGGVDTAGLVRARERSTSVKTRYIASSQHARQQILRVDRETNESLDRGLTSSVAETARARVDHGDLTALL